MGQLTQNVIYFNDSAGAIRPSSQHFFYEAGTTTDKAVYADKELTTPLAQPVISSADGILPQIWLDSGGYRWIGKDSADVQFFDRDDINIGDSIIDTASALIFKTQNDMILGILANGESVDLQPDQTAYTQGNTTQTDGDGKEYLVLAVDSGGDVALNNGRFAHAQANFISPANVDTKISTHNSDTAAHGNIDNKISTAVSAHNSSGVSHDDIRLGLRRRMSLTLSPTGSTSDLTISSDGVTINSVTKGLTGIYDIGLDTAVAIDSIQLTPVFSSGAGGADKTYSCQYDDNIPMNGSITSSAFTIRCFSTLTGGALVDGGFRVTVFYTTL